MHITTTLRQFAKKIGPLYWLVGYIAYLRFARSLRIENLAYAAQPVTTIPPPKLRHRVHGALDQTTYIAAGKSVAACLERYLDSHGIAAHEPAILDFACGPGRVAVEIKKLMPSCHLYGSDIDSEAIAWAQDNLSNLGNFATNEPFPPTRYANDYFDVVYTISLFTHLDESSQKSWLAELARILKPGGLLLATTHGAYARTSCTPDELRELERNGIAFRIDRKGRFKLDGLPDFYQTTFHTHAYVAKVWGGFFEIVDHIQGGLDQHQDLVILRRR